MQFVEGGGGGGGGRKCCFVNDSNARDQVRMVNKARISVLVRTQEYL